MLIGLEAIMHRNFVQVCERTERDEDESYRPQYPITSERQ